MIARKWKNTRLFYTTQGQEVQTGLASNKDQETWSFQESALSLLSFSTHVLCVIMTVMRFLEFKVLTSEFSDMVYVELVSRILSSFCNQCCNLTAHYLSIPLLIPNTVILLKSGHSHKWKLVFPSDFHSLITDKTENCHVGLPFLLIFNFLRYNWHTKFS